MLKTGIDFGLQIPMLTVLGIAEELFNIMSNTLGRSTYCMRIISGETKQLEPNKQY